MEQMTVDERQAALNEVMVLAMLDHPNIIRYYENFLEDTALMIVMEYAEGKWYHTLVTLQTSHVILFPVMICKYEYYVGMKAVRQLGY